MFKQISTNGKHITSVRIGRERDPLMQDVDDLPGIAYSDPSRCYWNGQSVQLKRELSIQLVKTAMKADGTDEAHLVFDGSESFVVRVGDKEYPGTPSLQLTTKTPGPVQIDFFGEEVWARPVVILATEV